MGETCGTDLYQRILAFDYGDAETSDLMQMREFQGQWPSPESPS